MEVPVPATIVEIPAQTGAGMVLHPGDILKIVDLHGKQVADLALFRRTDLTDSFSPGRGSHGGCSGCFRPARSPG